ncbi:uncharacterized protein LOC110448184 [Mizuhopecten yessoensis]|uniref:Uncharacterized protein n=1 Tax=Mizuhopecten yessoensis TaxID=6573 RepID=A0A210R5Q7_MIZYE|nr:uncharacterized protein LOC110448184 [Mizuhopecten yessoensis]OWF56370.1 hypothetical protein KP79_PYT14402 [Mizuhopecten yessoensis]
MAVTLGICLVVICAWAIDGYPAKVSEFQVNQLSKNEYEQKDVLFSTDMSNSLGPRRIVGPNVGQFRPESDWTYQLVDNLDGRSKRQKRQVKKSSEKRKVLPRKNKPVRGKKPNRERKPVQNRPKGLPQRQNEGIFKKSLRDILILGTKKESQKKGKPNGTRRKTPRRSNKGSFSIVPAKPKPRRGWRSRLRSRARAMARARARSGSGSRKPKSKKITRKTVRRGFVILD